MSQRLNPAQFSAAQYEKMAALSEATRANSTIETSLLHLIDARVSQINGCAFCLDMHIKMARAEGESELRLHHLALWHDSPLFSQREKAAFKWAEAVTLLTGKGIAEDIYQEALGEFGEKDLSDLTFAIASINSWNRLAAPFNTVPGSADALFGLDAVKLG
ncbi:carboxymuconolactone decarboxylase family protein [Terasakiella pusilla]|uniref:carboxymuconolactone decarboxylase family protein n=1 Tax=Terasakiella pusilla TaxID=64973 RepID=UPI003AA81CA2